MFPVDKVKLLKSRCLSLREIASIIDHRPVNRQVIKYFLGDKPEETEMGEEGVTRGLWLGRLGCCSDLWVLAAAVGLVERPLLGGGPSQRAWPLLGHTPPFLSSRIPSLQRSGGVGTSLLTFLGLGHPHPIPCGGPPSPAMLL